MEPPAPNGPRWLVVLVRPPHDGLSDASVPTSGSRMFPALLLSTHDRTEADTLAHNLRDEGALVAVIGEGERAPVTCERHPPQLLGRNCNVCGQAICAMCFSEAGGHRRCTACAAKERNANRRRRLRQLFSLFLFAVFCFKVAQWVRAEAAHLDPARGIRVAVFQFAPAEELGDPLIKALNEPNGPYSLLGVQDWYSREFARFTGAGGAMLHMGVFGPWATDVAPPTIRGEDAAWWQIAWTSWAFSSYWHGLAREFGAEPDAWDARVYLVYGRESGDLAADSRGSSTGRIAVSFVSLNDPDPAYAQVTVAHELGHVFGAEDLYDGSTYLAQVPYGLAEPFRKSPYPQRYAEVMAVDRPISPTMESEVKSLEEVRVGFHSAALMGWIEPNQADAYYYPMTEVVFGPAEAPPPAHAPEAADPPDSAAAAEGAAEPTEPVVDPLTVPAPEAEAAP